MKIVLSILLLLIQISVIKAQVNDLELANRLIGQSQDSIETIISRSGNDYTITKIEKGGNGSPLYHIYIEGVYGGVKHWKVDLESTIEIENRSGGSYRLRKAVSHIRIIYEHSSSGHLKDFKAYETPEENEIARYDKSMGTGQSHLELFYKENKY
jgi:hypothetical protein